MHDDQTEVSAEVDKLQKLAAEAGMVLYRLSSHRPLDFFPDELTIEKTKINYKAKVFFSSDQVKSILISEISTVEVITSLFFATLRIHSRIPNSEPIEVRYLRPDEAKYARRIIQGLMVGLTNHIDVTKVPTENLLPTIEDLGSAKTST